MRTVSTHQCVLAAGVRIGAGGDAPLRRAHGARRNLTIYYQVDMLGVRCKFDRFSAPERPGAPNW